MWSHYTNNHKGYCIEFEIIQKDLIFPVRYTNQRILSATIISRLCKSFLEGYESKKTPGAEFWHYYKLFMLTYCSKSSQWKYEHEYRFFDFNEDYSKPGMLIPVHEMGLEISQIYIGINCNSEYEQRLVEIGQLLGVPVYKMKIGTNSTSYILKKVKL